MKSIGRHKISLICAVLVIAVLAVLFFYKLEERFMYSRLEAYLQGHHITEDISFSYVKGTEIKLNATADPALYIAVLPNDRPGNDYRVNFSRFKTLVIGDEAFRSGDDMGDLARETEGEPRTMKIYAPGGELLYDGWIEFLFTDSTSSMHITTSENAIGIVDETGKEKEKPHIDSWIRIINGDGNQDVIAGAEIFRHGNSTFDNYNPKSYNLTLKSTESLLGMPPGRKWVLKANSMDNTQIIRNEMAFKASGMTGLEPYPDSRYINLYINGKYYGAYLLSQRINGTEMPDPGKGGYLLEMDYRYKTEPHYFVSGDKGIVVHYPEEISQDETDMLQKRYMEAEEAVKNGNGYEDYIDVDSFARMYIIQDFFVQADVDFSSFYFTYESDGKFHAGPVWDFDLSCGMTSSLPYHEELASRARLFDVRKKKCVFLGELGGDARFMERVKELYLGEFQQEMAEYMEDGWDKDISAVSGSLEVNRKVNEIRDKGRGTLDSTDSLKAWIEKRNRYLLSYYEDTEEYAKVTFHFAWGLMPAAVKKGEPIGFMPDDSHPGNDDAFWGEITGFVDKSGKEVDDSLIVDSNMDLYAVYTEDSYAWTEYSLP